MPSGARNMALAVEIQLPVNALTPNQSSLIRLIERAAAGDTSQEIFLRVYKHLGRFKQDQDFFGWLYGITVNVCRDIAKKRQHHSDRFSSFDAGADERAYAVPAEQEDAEEAFMHAQQRELIGRAMATLPDKERASIVLRDIQGLTTDEVARILKSSSTTVRSQIS